MNNLPEYVRSYVKNERDGYYALIYDDLERMGYNTFDKVIENELKFYELIYICRYSINTGLLYYILLSSDKKLQKLMIPYGHFVANAQIRHILRFINFDILTHLDIQIPVLDDGMTNCMIGITCKGVLSHIGVNPSKVIGKNNVRLFQYISNQTTIRSISIYNSVFVNISDITDIFKWLTSRKEYFYDHIMIQTRLYDQLQEKKDILFRCVLIWLKKFCNVKKMDLYVQSEMGEGSFFNILFGECLWNNTILTSLNIINCVDDNIKNGLELMRNLFHKNYTLTHLSFNFKERKRSVRIRKTNELIQSFCKRNLDLTKRFKTLFELLIKHVDFNGEYNNKIQRVY